MIPDRVLLKACAAQVGRLVPTIYPSAEISHIVSPGFAAGDACQFHTRFGGGAHNCVAAETRTKDEEADSVFSSGLQADPRDAAAAPLAGYSLRPAA